MTIKESIDSLNDLELKVYNAMVGSIFSSNCQFDIAEAKKISGINGNKFSGVVSSLYKKGLYNFVGYDNDGISNHPKKTIYDELSPNGYDIRTDIGFVVLADDEQ
jgi:hypothetical protein